MSIFPSQPRMRALAAAGEPAQLKGMEALLAYYTEGRQTATLPIPRQPVTLGSSREDWLPLR